MTNVMALTDRLIEASGLDAADVRLRARYLREAGLLPNAPKGGRPGRKAPPQIETVHAVILLLGCLATGPQMRTPEAVKALWALPMAAQAGILKHHDQTVEQGPAHANKGMGLSFGQVLLSFTGLAASPDQDPKLFMAAFEQVVVVPSRPQGRIHYPDRAEYFISPGEPSFSRYRAPVETMTIAPPFIFLELAEIVIESRRQAAQLGIAIPWQEAWRALGFEPPREMFPQMPLVPLSTDGADAHTKAVSGIENGAPGRAPLDQPHAKREAGSRNTPEGTCEREKTQALAGAKAGTSLLTFGAPHASPRSDSPHQTLL